MTRTLTVTTTFDTETDRIAVWKPGLDWVEVDTADLVRQLTVPRRNRNNGKRGRAAELTAARVVGGRKVGPMGWPWDVEMPGYARLQVKKHATPPSLRSVSDMLAAIAAHPGPEMPGFVWIEPGRDGERLIVFRLGDFADRHGVPSTEDEP